MGISKVIGAACAVAFLAGATSAQETSENRVAAKTDWSVFVEENPTECWSVSTPKEWDAKDSEGRLKAVNRSQILLMVFYRPSAGAAGQVAYTGGYPFKDGSTVNIDIGGTRFEMFTDGEWAWPASPSEDAKLITAMKRGANAVVSGVSGRNNTTRDTFSLLGFTAAVEDAEKRCAG